MALPGVFLLAHASQTFPGMPRFATRGDSGARSHVPIGQQRCCARSQPAIIETSFFPTSWSKGKSRLKHPEQHEPVAPGLVPTADDLATATDTLEWFEEDIDRACVTLPANSRIFRVRLGYREQDYRLVAIPLAEMCAPRTTSVKEPGRANRMLAVCAAARPGRMKRLASNRMHLAVAMLRFEES